MSATRNALIGLLGSLVVLAGCASSGASHRAGWSQQEPKSNDSLPTVSARGQDDVEVEQTGEPGKLREPKTESVPVEGTDGLVKGRSTVVVNAPIDEVRKHVLRFDKYADFMPHYNAARVLRRSPDGSREVYMQWAALHGAIKMWARFEMHESKDGDTEVWSSKFVEGNVRQAQASWRMTPLEADRTELTLEAFLLPKLPMPSSLLNDENTSGAEKGVVAMRKRIEDD